MLARKILPQEFKVWNSTWGAPFGRASAPAVGFKKLLKRQDEFDSRGIFGFQGNNDTRAFEYPWAYFNGSIKKGMQILEVGGGMSGFQFTASKAGASVINVDPGMDNIGGRVSQEFFDRANSKLGTNVKLIEATIANADIASSSFDLVYSISVIEHIPPSEIASSMKRIRDLLKPGGKFIMTVDLFLDLHPFSKKDCNCFGSNISIKDLVDSSGLQLYFGEEKELYGYESFDSANIMALLPELLIGTGYPTLVQCVILTRPA